MNIVVLFLTLFSCKNEKHDWGGIWHTSVEYVPNLQSDLEIELHQNIFSGKWSGRWEALGLFVSGKISKVEIDGIHIHIDLGDGGVFKGKLSSNKLSLEGILDGFSLDGNDTLKFVKVDEWTSEKPALVDSQGNAITQWNYSIPQKMNDGWKVKDLNTDNNLKPINDLFQNVIEGQYPGLDAVLISHNGQLVVEEYFHLGELEKLHALQSCTKSITSLLIGIAYDQGLIKSLSQPIQSFFPGYLDTLDTSTWPVSLENALTMSAGLDWKEWGVSLHSPESDLFSMNNSEDMYSYILKKDLAKEFNPGDKFEYNTGLSVLLGGVILNVADIPADEFAERNLFNDLGIKDYSWYILNGIVHTGGGLWLHPRDFLKLGQLVLNNGEWNGKQLISKSWIKQSTTFHLSSRDNQGYGYQWWRGNSSVDKKEYSLIWAEGLGGQFLFLVPELELVVLFLHHNPNDLTLSHTIAWKEMGEFIIPTFLSN